MFEVRIHGRGGQGVVTAAELLSIAAFLEGWHAQAFPTFAAERTGAPVVALCRIDDHEIRSREPVMRPNALIIQDATLLHQINLFEGLVPSGYLLINPARSFDGLGLGELIRQFPRERMLVVPATELALRHLGRPLPNAVLLGGFTAICGRISLDTVVSSIRSRFPGKVADGNVAAARAAFDFVRAQMKEPAHAQAD